MIIERRILSRAVSVVATSWLIAEIAYANSAQELIETLTNRILRPFATFLLVLATLVFLVGIVEYIANSTNNTARSTGRRHIIWGIIGLAIMLSTYFIVKIMESFFYPNG